jgi:hypothetical protein
MRKKRKVRRHKQKAKVKFTLEQAMEAERGGRGIALLSLTSVLDGVGGQYHAPAALFPRKRADTHCTGDWVGCRAGLDGCGKPRSHGDSIPRLSNP